MDTSPSTEFHQFAIDCVGNMGDIFWDYVPSRDVPLDYRDPYEIAVEKVETMLREVVFDTLRTSRADSILRSEYETLMIEQPTTPTDEQIVETLVTNADWTERGAKEVLHLARYYGTSILRNALALAEAMKIEDGDSGL